MKQRRREDGFTVAWLAVLLPLILTFMGLVLDFGVIFLRGQMLDSATDAAALAATDAWDREYWKWHGQVRIDPNAAASRARAYLARNMSDARVVQVTVSPANRVNVKTEATVPYFFLRILGWKSQKVESFSTAVRRNVR